MHFVLLDDGEKKVWLNAGRILAVESYGKDQATVTLNHGGEKTVKIPADKVVVGIINAKSARTPGVTVVTNGE